MATTQQLKALGFSVLSEGEDREITSVYCGDLLSIVMGRAPADSAWVTMMGNVNAVAVAVLADTACIIVAEGLTVDSVAVEKAKSQGVWLLQSQLPVLETALAVKEALNQGKGQ